MLHKTSYMRGFHVQAIDGGIGHVEDFLVDEGWAIRFLVVDTSNWWGHRLLQAVLRQHWDWALRTVCAA